MIKEIISGLLVGLMVFSIVGFGFAAEESFDETNNIEVIEITPSEIVDSVNAIEIEEPEIDVEELVEEEKVTEEIVVQEVPVEDEEELEDVIVLEDNTNLADNEVDVDEEEDLFEHDMKVVDTNLVDNETEDIIDDISDVEVEGFECVRSSDVNGDDFVNMEDILDVLKNWGECLNPNNCPWDVTNNGQTDSDDISCVKDNWTGNEEVIEISDDITNEEDDSVEELLTECVGSSDINDSGDIEMGDVLAVLSNWGPCNEDGSECIADLDEDGFVGDSDLQCVLFDWNFGEPHDECVENPDINRDLVVDMADLLEILRNWGSCLRSEPCTADLNNNLYVEDGDIACLLKDWGRVTGDDDEETQESRSDASTTSGGGSGRSLNTNSIINIYHSNPGFNKFEFTGKVGMWQLEQDWNLKKVYVYNNGILVDEMDYAQEKDITTFEFLSN